MCFRIIAILGSLIFFLASSLASPNPERAGMPTRYAQLPLSFEQNQGQASSTTLFVARHSRFSVLLSRDEMLLLAAGHGRTAAEEQTTAARAESVIRVKFHGINPTANVVGLDELTGKSNYFIGSDRSRWRTNVPTYAKVRYESIYSGIDLVFYGNPQRLEYDFVIRPGADAGGILLDIIGATSGTIESGGSLVLRTGTGAIRFNQPVIYQDSADHHRQFVSGGYKIRSRGRNGLQVSFKLAPYDHSRPLIIDPVLDYSTYLGGTGNDYGASVAVDASGNAYIIGQTASLNFPATAGSVQPTHAPCGSGYCEDAFVTKIDPTGTTIVYSTFMGGSSDEFGVAIAVDPSGSVYVGGDTTSTDFPTTSGAVQRSCGGTCFYNDVFVSELDSTGSALLYSTYLGGSNDDFITGIAIYKGLAIVSGFSGSADFPVTAGAYQPNLQGQGSSFVTKFNASGTALAFSTFLGEVDLWGSGPALAVDSSGNAYLAGTTTSPNFPVTPGAFHTPFLPTTNLYVTKLNSTGSALVYSARIGGAWGASIALDGSGNSYVAGTAGVFYPITAGGLNETCNDQIQGTETGIIAAKLSANGSSLLYSAHLCPDRSWSGGVQVDSSGSFLLTGYTDSQYLPTTTNALQLTLRNACCFSDAFLTKLNLSGTARTYSTYFGGNNADYGSDLAIDGTGNVYLVGSTSSTNLRTQNALQSANAGQSDAFLAKFTLPKPRFSISPAVVTFLQQGVGLAAPPKIVTFANVGTTALGVSSFVTKGDFSATGDCGAQLSPGARCTIHVIFKPTATGTRTGTLTITDSAGSHNVALRGTGVTGPLVVIPPVSTVYAPSGITSAPFTITVNNVGSGTLHVSSLGWSGSFNFVGSNCFLPLAPVSSCTVQMTYTANGSEFEVFNVYDDAPGSPQGIFISGQPLTPGIQFSSLGVRFDQQSIGGKSAVQKVAVMNGSPNPVSITSIGKTGDFVKTQTCGTTLAVGAFCYINISFKPTAVGIRQGSVVLTDSAAASPQVLPLLGTGGAAAAVALSSTSLSFASQAVGTTSPAQNVSLSNTGGSVLTMAVTLGGINPGEFAMANNCGLSLAPGANCAIKVTFKPTATGTRTAVISITDNAAGSPQKITLTGSGS